MIQGTGSGVGKSILVAGLCRILKQDGINVAPFKAQNMALNSFVTQDNLEMGRAQVFQAEAAGVEPQVEMNPVLLKPSSDNCSQVIVMGRPIGNRDACSYYKEDFRAAVTKAFAELSNQYEVILLEGAGSPAEINLRDKDFVNMWMAREANAPVLIVGDIDRGGVFAWMKGTFDLLDDDERKQVKGFIINKFRGDIQLLEPGIQLFENMVTRPVLGTIPFFHDIYIDEEDGLFYQNRKPGTSDDFIEVAVVTLPHMSNFTDFASLEHEAGVSLHYAHVPNETENPDVLILPGTKNTIGDLAHLQKFGWVEEIEALCQSGTMIIGICGGFQMLGRVVKDPNQVESETDEIEGLGYFEMETEMAETKTTRQRTLYVATNSFLEHPTQVSGYEIHMGQTRLRRSYPKFFQESSTQGIISENGQVWGTYLHGIFDNDEFRWQLLDSLRKRRSLPLLGHGLKFSNWRERQFDKLAELLRRNLDIERIYDLVFKRV